MTAGQRSDCNPAVLQDYLSERTTEDQEAELFLHLEKCGDCRTQLELAAAEPTTWDTAQEFLADAENDSIQLSGLLEADSDSHSQEGRDDTQTAQVANVLRTLQPTDDPHMLGRLGPYEISGVVGAGGMGIVLKGHDLSLERTVAIKVLAPHLASSGAARKRFAREAKAAAAVLHPNVMSIHGVKNDGALPYLVMPYMRGASLQKRIDEQGPLTTKEILRVSSQIAAGLAAAHAQGLVHRDIKPANMMLAQGLETVAITDFGLARAVDDATMTRSGVIAGTPQYMSPEQARGEPIDARSDLFSLGSLIYAMCTGHSPFRAETSFGVLQRITTENARDVVQVNPEIPTWLSALVGWLHEKRPEKRIQTAREAEQLLNECLSYVEQPNSHPIPDALVRRARAQTRRTKRARGWAALRSWKIASAIALAVCLMLVWPFAGNVIWPQQGGAASVKHGLGESFSEPAESDLAAEKMDSQGKGAQVELPQFAKLWQELEADSRELETITSEIETIEVSLGNELKKGDGN